MSREYLFWCLAQQQPRELLCTDEQYNYYGVGICGFWLMFRRNRLKSDGRRGFYLTDAFAKCLGFEDLHQMKLMLTTLQYWRGFVSVERLRVAFQRYDERQMMFAKMAEEI